MRQVIEIRPQVAQVRQRATEVRTVGLPFAGVRRLVVVRHDRLGDVVLTIPAVTALRRAYPSVRLAVMVDASVAPLASMVEGVDEVLTIGGEEGRPVARLRAFRPDLAVCISRDASIAWAIWKAGARHRVGPGRRFFAPLFERRVVERRRAGERHELEYALSFAHRAGAPTGEAAFPLIVPDGAEREVRAWREQHRLRRRGYVVIHPGTGGSCPRWPIESYLRLAARLVEGGPGVVLSVGPDDTAVATALDEAEPAVRALPRFSGGLEALAALTRRAGIVVSNSTGPLHLAAALGAPTLAIHAPWPTCGVARWGPYAHNGWAVVARGAGASRWSRRNRRRHGNALMSAIPVESVARCAEAILAGTSPTL